MLNKGRATISDHISNIFKEGELEEKSGLSEFPTDHSTWCFRGKNAEQRGEML